ncbi:MAG: DUF262 domain-containing protein [[Eubacterium] sulci]|nr:DUF262 domain-containing protein [[Eubacterium] sulci]
MNDIVQPKEFNIENIFEGNKYVIPLYQRNYAWGIDEIEQLLDDIYDAPVGRDYFLGSLIVNYLVEEDKFEVIDGQQRLTTLYLLLSYYDKNYLHDDSLQFEAREKSNKTLKKIYKLNDKEDVLDLDTGLSDEIIEGYAIVNNYFRKKSDDEKKTLGDKFKSIKIIRTQVPAGIDLNHYFEVMNTRGEQLELHEIAKARIIGAITSDENESDDSKDKEIAVKIWDACSRMDKYVQMCFSIKERGKIFGDDWDSFSAKDFEDLKLKYEEVNKLSSKSIGYGGEDTSKLSEILSGTREDVSDEKGDEEEDDLRFESIISFPNFILQVNKVLQNINDEESSLDDKDFLKQLEDRWSSKGKAVEFIYSMLKYRYIFDRYIIKREYTGETKLEGTWSLKRLKKYIGKKRYEKPSYLGTFEHDNKNNILKVLESCLRVTYTSPKTMHWVARVMNLAKCKVDVDTIINELESYCCKKVEESHPNEHRGFSIERIVFTYLDYILYRDNINEFKDFYFQFRTSIEHFFPRHPIGDEKDVSEEHRDDFGNLALITTSANSVLSNNPPEYKVKHKKVLEQSPKFKRMADLLENKDRKWDDDLVNEHGQEMINLLDSDIRKRK